MPGNVLPAFGNESSIAACRSSDRRVFSPYVQQGSAIATIRSSGMI